MLGAFIPLRSTVGFELWMGNRAGATGFLDESVFPIFNRWEYDEYASKGEVAYMRDKSAIAKAYIRSHPGEFLRLERGANRPLLDRDREQKRFCLLRDSCSADDRGLAHGPVARVARTSPQAWLRYSCCR